ncbi:MAG: type III pantothenate kinase [Rhodobacteraceae bacterium]|nr:type III pantothenate kinase [Paracoccaceae bacterium]
MLLAIDIGNTNSGFSLHDGTRFIAAWRCATKPEQTADEYFVWLSNLMNYMSSPIPPRSIDRVVVSAVVPQVLFNIRVLCDRYFECRPLVVGKPECRLGIDIRVDSETEVGADRIVNTVGAFDRYGGDLIVVDFGTATTFDVVDSDGAYIGGVIAPGVNLSMRALHQAAAALPRIDVGIPERVVGTNTVACMRAGVFWGYVGLIGGICSKIQEERQRKMKVIGTGGLAGLFERGTDVFDEIDGDLTMHGLYLIDAFNRDG